MKDYCKNKIKIKNKTGFSLIEVLLAISLFGIVTAGIIGVILLGSTGSIGSEQRVKAAALLEEGVAVMRNKRDDSYSNLTDGTYGLVKASGNWTLDPSPDVTDEFTRTVVISTEDTNTKIIDVQIEWDDSVGNPKTISSNFYLTNWTELITVVAGAWEIPGLVSETDLADGNNVVEIDMVGDVLYAARRQGDEDLTIIDTSDLLNLSTIGTEALENNITSVKVKGDYVYLGSTANAEEIMQVDATDTANPVLSYSYDAPRGNNMNAIYIEGDYLYTARARNNRSDEFFVFDISDPSSVTMEGSLSIAQNSQDVYVKGNYAYLANDANASEIIIIDISDPTNPTQSATLDMAGGNNGTAINGVGNYLYIGRDNGLVYILDITVPTSPVELGSYDVGGSINDIDFSSSFLFLATANATDDFQILDITDPSSIQFVGSYNTSGGINAIYYSSSVDRVFIGGSNNTREIQIYSPS